MGGPAKDPPISSHFEGPADYGWDNATPFGASVRLADNRFAGRIVTMRPLLSLAPDSSGVAEVRSKTKPVFDDSEYPAGEIMTAAESDEDAPWITRTPLAIESTV